jgi:hypothetical protein
MGGKMGPDYVRRLMGFLIFDCRFPIFEGGTEIVPLRPEDRKQASLKQQ